VTAAVSGLPSEPFPAKRDAWLVALLWGASLIDVGVAAWLLLGAEPGARFVAPLLLAAAGFQLHALYSVEYTLDGPDLRLRASFVRWRVSLAAIDAVEPTRSPLSGPAPSLDRLEIRYGKKRVMISPADKGGFLRALVQRAPQLELNGDGARRRGRS
jgi:Bacterial PH domain